MGRPPICHAFTMVVGKSFGIPAILFYQANVAKKSKQKKRAGGGEAGGDDLKKLNVP